MTDIPSLAASLTPAMRAEPALSAPYTEAVWHLRKPILTDEEIGAMVDAVRNHLEGEK